jgi:replicative DNA helicase
MYQRLTDGLEAIGKLIPENANVYDFINKDQDYYLSVYKYSEQQKLEAETIIDAEKLDKVTGKLTKYKRIKGVKGVEDVVTNIIGFDFDHKTDLNLAKEDTIKVVERLIESGIDVNDVHVSFSGGKGFSVVVYHDKDLTPIEHKAVAEALAGDLGTWDTTLYNASRIFRVDGTKHNTTGLYKTPLDPDDLYDTVEVIKQKAKVKTVKSAVKKIKFPEALLKIKPKEKVVVKSEEEISHTIDFSKKPFYLTDLKYVLQQGFIPPSDGNEGMMILCSTYKYVGFDKQDAYYMLKSVNEKRSEIYNIPKRSKSEIFDQVVNVIYHPSWKGGTYSVENSKLLQETAKKFGLTESLRYKPKFIADVNNKFKSYVKNIDKNTIKTGIPLLDSKLFLSTGANVALLGAPGSGKSSLALEILRNTSIAGIKTVFASFDMSATRMHEKILYKLTGLSRDELYKIYKEDKDAEILKQVEENFGNVFLYDKSMSTVEELKNYILKCQEESGEKIKMVMIDYFERIFTTIPDDTASSKRIAGELQNLVNELDICLITLVQPNKMSGDMSSPIVSYSNIKGSSFLAQSFRIIIGIYREGFSPLENNTDKFMTVNILKNDLGENFSLDFRWNGKQGEIYALDGQGKNELSELRDRKNGAKKSDWDI